MGMDPVKEKAYLSRLGRGMDPVADPRIPFFAVNSFSTSTTFPVRAASSSSCSFPIATLQSLQIQSSTNAEIIHGDPLHLHPLPPPSVTVRSEEP